MPPLAPTLQRKLVLGKKVEARKLDATANTLARSALEALSDGSEKPLDLDYAERFSAEVIIH